MSDKKVISVIGATGAQGGGLVRAILNDKSGGFSVRALTRDVNSDKAKALAEMGAEVVAADLDNAESLSNTCWTRCSAPPRQRPSYPASGPAGRASGSTASSRRPRPSRAPSHRT